MRSIGTGVFNSRLARRLFALFILSSVLPVLALATLSFNQVTDQLLEQNQRALHHETKAIGMAVLERLLFLETEMQLASSQLELGDKKTVTAISDTLKGRLNKKFSSLGWVTDREPYVPLLGKANHPLFFEALNTRPSTSEQVAVISLRDTHGQGRLFMAMPVDLRGSKRGFLVGELDVRYLVNAEVISIDQNLCVLDHLNTVLFCSSPAPDLFFSQIGEAVSHTTAGHFEWAYGDQDFLTSYWSLFLKNEFSTDDWTISLSTPKKIILQPIANFQNTLAAIVIITVLIVLILSMSQIRRILTPLKKLMEGTHNIANINFDRKVIINSHDEFSDLAASFNDMSRKLAQQFQSLEAMAEIDRLILSSQDSTAIVQKVLMRIQDIIQCDLISIAMLDGAGNFNEMYIRAQDQDAALSMIDFLPEDKQRLCSNPQGIILEFHHLTPGYLQPLAEQGAKACLVLPLYFDSVLSAIIALGYKDLPNNANQKLLDARSWIDRIAVALDNAKWQEKLYYQAHYDDLTGLPNRLALKDYLQQALMRAAREHSMVGVLFIDLDRFKLINDSLGHSVGDLYLKEVSNRIKRCVRTTDMAARLSGDEFTIVIQDSIHWQKSNALISSVAAKILDAIQEPIFVGGHKLQTTASIGVSIYPRDADNIDDLMKFADSAMYYAKANSGNNYRHYSYELNTAAVERLQIESGIRQAIENNEFELFFQPQMDTRSKKLVGAEALLRWRHPDKGMISPNSFIPIAEESMLISDIDLWVLNAAFAQLKAWKSKGLTGFQVSINVSARFFQRDDSVELLTDAFDRLSISAESVELEITEASLITNISKTLATLNALNRLGVKLAIDDFGTGYSSLSYLNQFPIHKLKIDQSFVRNCDANGTDSALVKTIINLAHDLRMECIAEGVETDAQLAFLHQHGCDTIQGYLFSRPLAVDEFEKRYLARQDSNLPEAAIGDI